jgi:hypothetical protein
MVLLGVSTGRLVFSWDAGRAPSRYGTLTCRGEHQAVCRRFRAADGHVEIAAARA